MTGLRVGPQPQAPARTAPEPTWRVRPVAPVAVIEAAMRDRGLHPLVTALLWGRGLRDDALDAVLDPPLKRAEIGGLEPAANRLRQAIEAKERILIHGDYDADGITGTAVLLRGLARLGARVDAFLPNRLTHGYGVHPALVPQHADACDLLVTVDCGIGSVAEVRALRQAGCDVIVSDHHEPGEVLPDACIVHPRVRIGRHGPVTTPGPPAPLLGEPTGAGVAFHLLWRLHDLLGEDPPLDLADLAAIGTIADVAPLLGANRALVREGLARMPATPWPGLQALLRAARLTRAPTAQDVAFVVAPRLNAAGRLGEPEVALELLVTDATRRADTLATYLDARNDERRAIQDDMLAQAEGQLDPAAPALVMQHDDWHPGVMGIVASKLLERWYRPVFLAARGQGSVRSTPGLSAVQALQAAAPLLERFGGHAAAAGFAIRPERFEAFRSSVIAYVAARPTPLPTVTVDAVLAPEQIDGETWWALRALEPYGEGLPPPTFAVADRLGAARAVGKGAAHLQLRLGDVKGIAWGQADRAAALRIGRPVQVAASLSENRFRDRRTLEFVAAEVRPAARLAVHDPGPDADGPAPLPVRRLPPDLAGPEALQAVPLGEGPVALHLPFAQLLATAEREGRDLVLALDADALRKVVAATDAFPNLHDLRSAYRHARNGAASPAGETSPWAAQALQELALLGPDGRVHSEERVDPYASPTLRACLAQRYRFRSFRSAYQQLDDDAFARALRALFL